MSSYTSTEANQEQLALLANDIRILAEQWNDAVRRGAERGLKVTAYASTVLDVKGAATAYPVLSVRIQAEVR